MEKATREIEKQYLKHDEPVLNNVPFSPLRSVISSQERDLLPKKKSKNLKNISVKKKSSKSLNIWQPKILRAIGPSASTMLPF